MNHQPTDKRGERTSSALFHVSMSPRKLSGRVDSSKLNSNPNKPYVCCIKLNSASISPSIYRKSRTCS